MKLGWFILVLAVIGCGKAQTDEPDKGANTAETMASAKVEDTAEGKVGAPYHYVGPDRLFSIAFPGKPELLDGQMDGADGPVRYKNAMFIDKASDQAYTAASYVFRLPGISVDVALDGMAEFVGGGVTNAELVESSKVTLAGLPGREFFLVGSYPGKGEFHQVAQFYLDGESWRFYIAAVQSRGAIKQRQARAFFDSLDIPASER